MTRLMNLSDPVPLLAARKALALFPATMLPLTLVWIKNGSPRLPSGAKLNHLATFMDPN